MKVSKFNVIKKIDNSTIIYNTVSSGILMLNKEYSIYFDEIINTGNTNKVDLIEALKKASMVVDDNIDEVKSLELTNYIERFSDNHLSLTIAPTLECNFACPYCYEEGHRYSTMNKATQDNVVNFVKKFEDAKTLNVCWYGGEPLLKLDMIENLTEEFLKQFDKSKYRAGIVTNGYLLSKDVAITLKNNYIESVQITLDGTKDIHDSRRKLLNGEGSFEQILQNIKECCDIIPIIIRINVDKSNIDKIESLIECLEENGLINKVGFYLAPVDDINSSCKNTLCFDMKEFSEEEIRFYEKCLQRGIIKIDIPVANLGICGAITKNSYVIAPTGDLYKCWNEIGNIECRIGTLEEPVKFNNRLTKWLLYNPLNEYSECRECKSLPICYGGCPYNYMVGRGKRCTSECFNSERKIELLHLLKGKESGK